MPAELHEAYDRAATRMAVGYALRSLHRAAQATGGDILDGVIRVAIGDANVRHVRDDPALSQTYLDLDQPVPDERRRPVSINAIATSLNLPFETTRRRVQGLVDRGFCLHGRRGVLITAEGLHDTVQLQIIVENYEDLVQLRQDLRTVAPGLILEPEAEAPQPPGMTGTAPYRAAIRASMAFMLRFIEPMNAVTHDLLDGVILFTIGHANARHVADDPLLGKLYASAETPIPDDQMEPVSVQTLAKTLDLSFETARRRVRAMEARGWCARRRGGVYVPTSMALSPEMRLVMTAACGHLQRMYSGLWRLGVRFDPPAGG